jgi:Flp pilus assembly protein TadD
MQKERTAEAIKEFEAARELSPGSLRNRFNLGVAYMKAGKLDEARREFQQVLRMDPAFSLPPGVRELLHKSER